MTREKLLALTLATFALTAVVSGGATFAVLSDSHVVTANLGVGNVNVASTPSPTPTTTQESACDRFGDTAHSGNASENPGDISIVLEPTDQSIDAGNSTTYDVTVEGASRNITGYNLEFALCDPSVATFENFTHTYSEEGYTLSGTTTVKQGNISASAGVVPGIQGPNPHLGTITVSGNSSGETRLGIVNVDEAQVQVRDENNAPYNITSTSTVELKVNESENGS